MSRPLDLDAVDFDNINETDRGKTFRIIENSSFSIKQQSQNPTYLPSMEIRRDLIISVAFYIL